MTPPAPYRLTEQHDANGDCWRWHCWTHNVDEMRVGAPYIVCQECGHVYSTPRQLRKAHRAAVLKAAWPELAHPLPPLPETVCTEYGIKPVSKTRRRFRLFATLTATLWVRASQITFCVHCLHDF